MSTVALLAYVLIFENWIIDDRHLALYYAAYKHKEANRDEEAIKGFRAALKLKPDYVEAHIMLGNALMNKELFSEAATCFRNAISHVDPKADPKTAATAHFNLGNTLRKMKRYEKAYTSYNKALKHNPKHHKSWLCLGMIFEEWGNIEKAIDAYENAVEIKPGDASVEEFLKRCRARQPLAAP